MPRAYNTSFRNTKQPRTYDVFRKVKWSTAWKRPLLLCFINNQCDFWKLTFGHKANVTHKVRKSVYKIEIYFKFFTCLEKTFIFITPIFRTIYRSKSPEVFSKKGVCSIFAEEYSWSHAFARLFSCKLSKWFVEHLSWKTPLGDCFCIYESERSICLPAFSC